MDRGRSRAEVINQGIGRHHVLVAAVAVAVSLVLHATLLARLENFELLPAPARVDTKRFSTIEMADVQVQPPAVETLQREPLDDPNVAIPSPQGDFALAELAPPEIPPRQLPEPEDQPAPASPRNADSDLPPAVRQEVLAIQDRLYEDEVSALPRRWVAQDIARIEQAPDIQLPVETGGLGSDVTARVANVSAALDDTAEAGSPEWSALMFGRGGRSEDVVEAEPQMPVTDREELKELLDERPDEISRVNPIEDLLQVKVTGYEDILGDGSVYFALHIERSSTEQLPVLPRDILFVQDSSESITPWKLDECRRGLKGWLDYLNPGDRFDIVSFREDITRCFGDWTAWNVPNRRMAYDFINAMRAQGNTDVYRSIQSAMSIEADEGRTMLVILVTDGRPTVGVTGSSEIIKRVTEKNLGRVAIFSVGGGNKVNSFFLDLLSYRNRGDAIVVKGEDEIPGAMEAWAGQLQRPVLTDLSYNFANIDDADIYPKQLTHLFLDRPLVIHGRLPAGADRFVFQVIGRAGTELHDMVFVIERAQIARGTSDLREQWAWQKIYHMIGGYIGEETPAKLEKIRSFSERYGIIVPYGFSRVLPRSN